ncbi:MAG: hypothetical protein FWF91_02220 [Coriobacteriia bacterium]|nr:hypothetical protein [Coriobacteriia bacterium]
MKKRILALVMVLILALGAAGVLVACGDTNGLPPAKPAAVKEIKTGKQKSGNVTFTNYSVIITADTDWAAMSESDKQKVIDYAFFEVYRMSAENDVRYYNVLGTSEDGNVLFMYDRDNNNVIIYSNGQKAGTLEIPENKNKAATTPATTTPEPEDQGVDTGDGQGEGEE